MPKSHDFRFLEEVGQRLLRRRESLNLTQAVVCRKARISPQQLSRYELGMSDAPVSTLKRICKALDISMTTLLMAAYFGDDLDD